MKNLIIKGLLLCGSMSALQAQTLQIEDVAGKNFNGVFTITSPVDNSVSGYYTYYEKDKGKKGMRTYQFAFVDTKVTGKITCDLEMRSDVFLNSTIFNGKFMLVSYLDWKNKLNVFKLIDDKGQVVKTKEVAVDRKTYRASSVFPAENSEGFYFITSSDPGKEGGVGYEIQKLDNSLNSIWSAKETTEKGGKGISNMVNANGRLILWQEYNVKSVIKPSIICLDGKTGKKVYERDCYDGESTILNNQIRVDKDGSVMLGGAYVNGEKMDYINTDGIYVLKLDPNGKDLIYSKVSNKEKIQPVLKAAASGVALGSKDKVYVEDLIIEGNDIVVVTEMFRKNINVTPPMIQSTRDLITGKWIGDLGGNDSDPTKFTFEIMDFMMFRFDLKGNLIEIKQIAKEEYNKITVWTPYTMYGGMALAQVMDYAGWFDYSFATVGKDGKKIMICKNNATSRKPEIYTYTLDKSYVQKKINLKQEAAIDLEKGKVGYFNALASDPGKVAVVYYQKKLDRITINLESIE